MRAAELTVLDQIILRKRAELVAQRALVKIEELEGRPRSPHRSFREALRTRHPAIIAEIKKASPSAGTIADDFQPAGIATRYEAAGAAALSVLTDRQFFQGSLDDLSRAREATRLPVLRKDFTLDRYHLVEAVSSGADAVLLIVAALTNEELRELLQAARDLELEPLVEVHDERELDRALEAEADFVGVNNRDLKTLAVSLETSIRLAERIPSHVVAISESGIRGPQDIHRLSQAGYRGFLIGESLMKQPDPGEALSRMIQGVSRLAP